VELFAAHSAIFAGVRQFLPRRLFRPARGAGNEFPRPRKIDV
jgi:hypothetical protein